MQEIWKDIKGFEGYYQISNLGRIKSVLRVIEHKPYNLTIKERIRKNKVDTKGYYYIIASKNGKITLLHIHRLVAQAFIPNPLNKPCINHIDGNKLNNIVSNLEWVTYKENSIHAYKKGLFKRMDNSVKKLKELAKEREKPIIQLKNGVEIARYESITKASIQTKVCSTNISYVANGRYNRTTAGGYEWKYVE